MMQASLHNASYNLQRASTPSVPSLLFGSNRLDCALCQIIDSKKQNVECKDPLCLLDKYDTFNPSHLLLFQQINPVISYVFYPFIYHLIASYLQCFHRTDLKATKFKQIIIFGNYLWFKEDDGTHKKITANTRTQWKQFLFAKKNLLQEWKMQIHSDHDAVKALGINGKMFLNAVELYDIADCINSEKKNFPLLQIPINPSKSKISPQTIEPPLKKRKICNKNDDHGCDDNDGSKIERKAVDDWSHYAIIYWLNRVNDGRFKDVKYTNLRKHIFIGKVRGNQLCHLNEVTLNMIGIFKLEEIDCILDTISELIENDEYNNFAANTVLTDNIPISYCDAMSFELMKNPVLLKSSGYIYERESIKEYIGRYHKDPLSQTTAHLNQMVEDKLLRSKIDLWRKHNCI